MSNNWIAEDNPPREACDVLILHEVDIGVLKEDKSHYNPNAVEGWEWETTFFNDPAAWKGVKYWKPAPLQ